MAKFPDDLESRFRRVRAELGPAALAKLAALLFSLLLAVSFLATSWFTVEPEEVGVVLRFGKYNRTVEPGLNFKLPLGLDRVYKVRGKRQLKQEFGYRTEQAGVQTKYSSQDFDHESLMLTGDLNVADIEWVTQYQIVEPFNFLFKVRNLEPTLRHMNEAVMREVVGDHSINEVLTTGRESIQSLVEEKLEALCQQYQMGILINEVILQDVNPPKDVKPAFNEVNQAQQERDNMINQAQQEYNKVIPKARGDAEKVLSEAQGYAVERVNRARGDADRFNAIFQEYLKSPEVTRYRIYLETMEVVLGTVGRKIILDEDATGVLPLLNLNQGGESK